MATSVLVWVLTYAMHSTVFLGLAWVVTRFTGLSLALREMLWKTALLGGFVTTSLHVGLGVQAPWDDFALPRALASRDAAGPALLEPVPQEVRTHIVRHDAGDVRITAVRARRSELVHAVPAPTGPVPTPWPWVLLGIVGFGSAFALARLVWSGHRLARELADRRDVIEDPLLETFFVLCDEAGIRNKKKMRLRASARLRSPVALWRREIVVPERAIDELTPDQQRGMLAHELAHLLRHDPLWALVAAVIEAVCFFQPLNHVARRELQEIAELRCDDWAARRAGTGIHLAKCLAEVASWLDGGTPSHPAAVSMAAERSPIVRRITRLLQRGRELEDGGPGFALRWAAALGLVGLVAWLVPGVGPAVAASQARFVAAAEAEAEHEGIMVFELAGEDGRPRSRVQVQTREETVNIDVERAAPPRPAPPPPPVPFAHDDCGWRFDLRVDGLDLGAFDFDALDDEHGSTIEFEFEIDSGCKTLRALPSLHGFQRMLAEWAEREAAQHEARTRQIRALAHAQQAEARRALERAHAQQAEARRALEEMLAPAARREAELRGTLAAPRPNAFEI